MKLFNSLRFKITLCCFVIILLFSVLLVLIIRTSVIKKMENNLCQNIYVEHEKIDEGYILILDTINLLYSPIVSSNIIEQIDNDTLTLEEKQKVYQDYMEQLPKDNNIFGDIILVFNKEKYHSLKTDDPHYVSFYDEEFIEEVSTGNKSFYQKGSVIDTTNTRYLVFGKPISKYYLPDDQGILIFSIKYDGFNQLLNDSEYADSFNFIVSNESRILLYPDPNYLDSLIFHTEIFSFSSEKEYHIANFNKQKSLIVISPFNKINRQYSITWHIVSVISYDSIFSQLNSLNTFILIIGITSIIMAFIMSYFLSAGLVGPVEKLNKRMNDYIQNKHSDKIKPVKGDEIAELEMTYNKMINTITNLLDENNQEQEEKRKLELDALQMQINPHFLYNTLDAIVWIARLKKQTEIEHLVMALAQFFRISLHKGDKFIMVEEEIELIRNFVAIELIRFPNKFTIDYQITDEVKNQETMKLIIQPIVENAIKHGVSTLEYEGHISIKAYCDDLFIYYEVIDNGLGFIPDENLFKGDRLSPSGYGLKNVNERIKLEYGDDCGITVQSHLNKGTRVIVKIVKRDTPSQ